jgi:DNA-binding XRE family transcriptional regulator
MNLKEKFHKYLPDNLDKNKCWEWKGSINRGYGVICHNKKTIKAHRVSYELYYEKPLNDLHCLHNCDNPSCVNPLHLFAGTNLDNVRDKINKGRCYTGHQKGEHNGASKLKDGDVIQIRELYNNQNYTTIKLGKMYGVNRATISYIVNNKTYTHLLEE